MAARFGIPVSTSHICVFAAVAVGLFEGRKGVNWWMVLQTICAMFITLGTAMGACAGLTSFGEWPVAWGQPGPCMGAAVAGRSLALRSPHGAAALTAPAVCACRPRSAQASTAP